MRFLLILLLLAGPAAAQIAFGYHDRFETRFGLLEVRGEPPSEQLFFNGVPVPGVANWSIAIESAFGLAEEQVDWVIVHSHNGGNACDPPRHILRVTPEGYTVSPPFADCIHDIDDVRVYPDRIELDMPHPDIAVAGQTFTYDGTELSVATSGAALGGQAAASSDPLRWVGGHAYRLTEDAAEQARFLAILSEDQLYELSARLSGPGENVVRRGDWVLGAACEAHACDTAAAAWGIRISDGAPAAAFLDAGRSPMFFGAPAAADPEFVGWVNERVF